MPRRKSPKETKPVWEKSIRDNKIDLQIDLGKLVKKYDLPFDPPYCAEDADEIIKLSRQAEFAELLRVFPNYQRLTEDEKLNCKLILKFGLDPTQFSLKDRSKINQAISRKLTSDSSEANPELFKFKR